MKYQGGNHMKNSLKQADYKILISGILISTFSILLIFIMLNMGWIFHIISKLLYALRYLFYGIVIAYILNQPVSLIENFLKKHSQQKKLIHQKSRGLAIFITVIFMIILIIILASLIIPNIIESLTLLVSNASHFISSIFQNIDGLFEYFNLDFRLEDSERIKQFINIPWQECLSQIMKLLSQNADGILTNASNIFSQIALLFTGIIFSFYLLGNKETYIRQLRKLIAAVFGYRVSVIIFHYGHKTNQIFSDFISGQLIEACILWVLYYITMRLFVFPYPELIATIIALFSFVPFFGPISAMCIGAILILSKDFFQAICFMIYFQILSQLEDNLIYPKVVGQSVGLPGIWVLLSILAFGDLFGIAGIVVAVPTSACLYALFSELVNRILKKRHLKISKNGIEKTSSQ